MSVCRDADSPVSKCGSSLALDIPWLQFILHKWNFSSPRAGVQIHISDDPSISSFHPLQHKTYIRTFIHNIQITIDIVW